MHTIRPAIPSDQDSLGRYGAELMRQHHASDTSRFILTQHPEAGYGRFLVSQIDDPECLVLVAEDAGRVLGYVYASLEGTSWRDLRGPCGFVHDVYVDEGARHRRIGRDLVVAAMKWIRSHDMRQVVLWSKTRNVSAQRLFASLGFRETMIEMTCDLGSKDA